MAAAADLSWFKPEPVQQDFITYMAKETVYAGGVGSGKTLSGGFKGLVVSHQYPGTVGLVGRQSYGALRDTTKKVMVDGDDKPPVIPPELISYRNDTENRITLTCGSEILFRSLEDHNIEKLLSLNLGWVYVDELTETTLKVWLTLLGRLRHPVGPRIAWGTTNPNGHDWVWKRFHKDGGAVVPSSKLYIQQTFANPHLAPDYIDLLKTMPPEWQKRFVYCSFDTAAGMIWDMWDRQAHVVDERLLRDLPSNWRRFDSMDHGRRNPTCFLLWAVDNDGNLIVEREYYNPGIARDHAFALKALEQTVSPGTKYPPIVAPPDCFRGDANGRTIQDEYYDATGLQMTPANDNVGAGILRVSEWLERSPNDLFPDWHPWAGTKGPDGLGAPRVFVSDSCTNLISEIPDYRWIDLSATQEKNRDQPEEPRKKDDHACDAFRYGIMSRPRPRHKPFGVERPKRTRQESAGLIDRIF